MLPGEGPVETVVAVLEDSRKIKQPPSRFYRPELDVLRFLAFSMVFIDHSLPYDGVFTDGRLLGSIRYAGGFGVCVFFMLSSFLITDLLEREHAVTHTIQLRAFYVRRILRIWPLYFSFLFFDFFLQQIRHTNNFPVGKLLAFLLLAGNWWIGRFGEQHYTPSAPLWSISVEEQFYLVWPSFRKYVGRQGSIILAAAMLIVSYVELARLCHTGGQSIWTNTFVQFQFFSTGALLSFALRGRTPQLSTAARVALFAGGIGTLIASPQLFLTRGLTFAHFGPGFFLVNVGCILIFLSLLGESRLGKWRILTYLGRISYGLYVFHWMILLGTQKVGMVLVSHHHVPLAVALGLRMIVAFLLTVILAALSYRFFEAPILRYKKRFEVIRTRPV